MLVVAAEPDERDSTRTLELLVEELQARPAVDAEVWFLRGDDADLWGPRARVVDRLRTAPGPVLLDALRLGPLAHRVRGVLLRRWFAAAAPDVVLLDDGLGGRVLPGGGRGVRVITRWNPVEPAALADEARWGGRVALHLVSAPDLLPAGSSGPVLAIPPLVRALPVADQPLAPSSVASGQPTVVGWGSDSWVDGADLFLRILWALEHRHGLTPQGVWYHQQGVAEQLDRLRDEAERCGVADRYHLVVDPGVGRRWHGDVVALPYRGRPTWTELAPALGAGREVVSLAACPVDDPAITVCPPLDVEGAATAVAQALGADQAAVAAGIAERRDVVAWVDRFLAAVDAGG